MSRLLRSCSIVLLALALLTALSGCGSEEKSDGSTSPDRSDSTTIDITIKDGTVKPAGSKVKVKAGSPVHLHIVSDVADELHVHSSPEQEIEFEKGTTDKTLTIDQPGVVDVEVHDLDKVVVQLEVS